VIEPPIVDKDTGEAVNEYRAILRTGKGITDMPGTPLLGVEHYAAEVVDVLRYLTNQAHNDSLRWFPASSDDLQHMVLALCGEAGETANALKKGLRKPFDYDKAIEKVAAESIDVFIYLLNIWAILKIDPAHELAIKRATNEERFGPKDAEV
jgi:NTP pyrophosphatase (non-canonical NTP hydrolase)